MNIAIIVAAGKGTRMNGTVRKQYLLLAGQPVICRTLEVFGNCRWIDHIYMIAPEDDLLYCQQNILSALKTKKDIHLVAGGSQRQESVYNGVMAIGKEHQGSIGPGDMVVVHDGVRPFITPEHIESCITAAKSHGACTMGIPVFDTLKSVNKAYFVDKTLERDSVWLTQTPQAFRYDWIQQAHTRAKQTGQMATDDAVLVEQLGKKVKMVMGHRYNIKITTQEDLAVSEAILKTSAIPF